MIVGLITAVTLTFTRGGFADNPWVLLVFGGAGFLVSLLLSWLFRRETLHTLDSSVNRIALHSWVRNFLASALAVSLTFWSGRVIISGGFGGWLLAILFWIFAPLIVCLVATGYSIVLGFVAATCIVLSILLENARWSRAHGNTWFWTDFWGENLWIWLSIWGVGAGLSLIVSVPIHFGRRHGRVAAAKDVKPGL